MTVLVAGGDSFTYGNELADCTTQQPSELTWSAFLAHKLEHRADGVIRLLLEILLTL